MFITRFPALKLRIGEIALIACTRESHPLVVAGGLGVGGKAEKEGKNHAFPTPSLLGARTRLQRTLLPTTPGRWWCSGASKPFHCLVSLKRDVVQTSPGPLDLLVHIPVSPLDRQRQSPR